MLSDWPTFGLGLTLGLAVSGLFFWGLNLGIRRALSSARPTSTLLASFILRMGLLLATGFGLAAVSASLWPMFGYVLAFFVVRTWFIRRARRSQNAAI